MSKIKGIIALSYVLIALPFVIFLMWIFNKSHRKIRKNSASLFLKTFRVKAKVIGEIDDDARIYVMNHQSFMDVIFMEGYCHKDICWVAKKELGEPFLYGQALKLPKMILINRESKKESIRLMKEAKDRLEHNRVLCIFPEGTRSKGLEKFLPFKNGAKFLIEHFKLKVQPIVFCGTRECLNFEKVEFKNSEFSVKFLESFVPSGENWFEALREKMQEEYSLLYRKKECMEE